MTPVVGTVLILVITVLGIAGVLLWGAPTIDRMQAENAQVSMTTSMEDLRSGARELSVPDHSRFPTIVVPSGVLALEEGTRFLVTIGHDSDSVYSACDLNITGWADTGTPDQFAYTATDCRPEADTEMEVHSVTGGSLREYNVIDTSGSVTVVDADLTDGDWLMRLTDGKDPAPTVYAQAWLLSNDRFSWRLDSATRNLGVTMDGGAVFSSTDGSFFVEKTAAIQDSAYGPDYYGIWMRTLDATSHADISGPGTYSAYLALMGNHLRAQAEEAYHLRFAMHGELAEAWCGHFLLRNTALATQVPSSAYTQDPTATCASGDGDGVRSVTYKKEDNNAFQFRFLHARILASLNI